MCTGAHNQVYVMIGFYNFVYVDDLKFYNRM